MATCRFCGCTYDTKDERDHMRSHPQLCEMIKLGNGRVYWRGTIAGEIEAAKIKADAYRSLLRSGST